MSVNANEPAQAALRIGDFLPDLPRPAVLCTLVQVTGSAPQEPGARLWVGEDRFAGTLGGGEFERRILQDARAEIAAGRSQAFLKEYILCKEMGQCCGGRAQVFFEPVPRRKAVHLFGGGHVGRATAHILAGMPFDTHLIDARPEWSERGTLPQEVRLERGEPLDYARARRWTAEDAVCLFTHSHELDFELTLFFLNQPVSYLGLIGSEHKAQVFRRRLESSSGGEALSLLWDRKMHCPIGAKRLSKNPKIIALAISGEIVDAWNLA